MDDTNIETNDTNLDASKGKYLEPIVSDKLYESEVGNCQLHLKDNTFGTVKIELLQIELSSYLVIYCYDSYIYPFIETAMYQL